MTTVAVAVNSNIGNGRGNGSKRAVRWAVENLFSRADRFLLVHIMPLITHTPVPFGDRIPIKELDANTATNYTKDVRQKAQEMLGQYKKLCKAVELEVETILLDHDDVATGLTEFMSQFNITSFVMGCESTNRIWRKIKGPGVPQLVLKGAPNTCDIFIVSERRVKAKLATSFISDGDIRKDKQVSFTPSASKLPVVLTTGQTPLHSCSSFETTGVSSWSEVSRSNSNGVDEDVNLRAHQSTVNSSSTGAISSGKMSLSETQVSYEQFDLKNEVEQLQKELHTTLALYSRLCENLLHAQNKVQVVPSGCVEGVEKANAATKQEESQRSISEQEKLKYLQALKDAEAAKNLLAKESCERRRAELNALKESKEKQRIVDALITSEGGVRRYTPDEIKEATDFFSENKVIGEGGYGKVYKGVLDHMPVAIKVLQQDQQDAADKKKEFLREVGILSNLRHPNIVLLLGVCPEMGCLVYEYMENGSLEEHIFRHNKRAPIPWTARFRIAYEIACGLAVLHKKKPEPIVHRDLKPGNILLGRNHLSKISDVGLAKLLTNNVPDSVTMFGSSLLAGTLYYIDPEYQRTGTIRPKSDLYSFGIILLQLLTARHPNGLLLIMENAIASGSLSYILDDSIKDWPLAEAEELTKLALECCSLRCRDRPDLETGVIPVLKKFVDVADASIKVERNNIFAPSHYFCPILHEIMDDPHVAADGFSYERRAIEAWFRRHDISPVTKHKLEHFNLMPNMTLLDAVQEWRSRLASKGNSNHL